MISVVDWNMYIYSMSYYKVNIQGKTLWILSPIVMNWSQCVFGTNTVSVGTGMVVLCPVVYSASVKSLPVDTAQRTSIIYKKAVNTQQISKWVLSVNMLRLKLGLCRIRRPCTPFLPLSTCPSIFYKHGQGFFFNKFKTVISSVPKSYAAVSCAKISLHAAIRKFYYIDGLM